MRLDLHEHPRAFSPAPGIHLSDLGAVELAPDEQLTFTTPSGRKNDILRKSWGFYLGNSINHNLRRQGLRTALVLSRLGAEPRLFINLVEEDKTEDFLAYLKEHNAELLCWMDSWLP